MTTQTTYTPTGRPGELVRDVPVLERLREVEWTDHGKCWHCRRPPAQGHADWCSTAECIAEFEARGDR